jgi:hypothetical protein
MNNEDKKFKFNNKNIINNNNNNNNLRINNNNFNKKNINNLNESFLSESESSKKLLNSKKVKFFPLNSHKEKKLQTQKSMSLNVSVRSSANSIKSEKSYSTNNSNSKNINLNINQIETSNFLVKNKKNNQTEKEKETKKNYLTNRPKFNKENKASLIETTKNLNKKIKNKKINEDPIHDFLCDSFCQTFDKMNIYFLTMELNEMIFENLNDQEITNDILANLEALKDSNELKKKEADGKLLSIEEDSKKSKIENQIMLSEFEYLEHEVFFIFLFLKYKNLSGNLTNRKQDQEKIELNLDLLDDCINK